MSLSLIDELYMGSILFRVNEACLFNMSLNNNSANETYVFSFDGFISKYSRDDDPAKPSQLEEWQVDSVGKNYYLTQIGCMNFIIDSIDDNDLREFEESIPFSCSFEKRDSFSIPHFKIDLKDIIILHKDLLNLEDAIIRNKPITEQTQLKPRQGISHKKILAKEVAKNIAIETWTKDIDKKIKISAMCEIIWFKLIDVGFSKELPANETSLKQWIKEVTPKYASEAGRPAS